jgi:hypothetical protein
MDTQFWIWLIIIVVTFLSRALKKSGEKRAPSPEQRPETDSKPMTFEDLLREIQESKRPQQPVVAKPARREIEPEVLETEPVATDYSRSYEVYEQAKREAFYRPSLEETVKLEDTDVKFGHFKQYDEVSQRSLSREILQDFKDPEGFKKAFIMSEVLKRKF